MQTALLYQVLVPPTAAAWKQYLGEVMAVIILFPSALLGFIVEKSGKMPPMIKQFINNMQKDDEA
jgi:hypothetical protein